MKDNWRVEFFGDNLLDDHGFLDSLHIELNGARARPRTVGLKVGVDF